MSNSVRAYFERATDYQLRGGSDEIWLKRYADDICRYLGSCEGKMILDLGCGNGKTTQKVIEQSKASIVGCDFSYPLLRSWGGVCADALELPFRDSTFDIVYTFSFLQYFDRKSYKILMLELARVLKVGGRIYHLSVPDRRHFWKWARFP